MAVRAKKIEKKYLNGISPPRPMAKFQNNFTEMFPYTKLPKLFRSSEQNGCQKKPLNDSSS